MNSINTETFRALQAALRKILKALGRLALRFGLSYEQFEELTKQAFVEVAEENEFMLPGRKQTDSRIAVVTGLSRKEVKRLRELERNPESLATPAQYNRAAKVLNRWLRDPMFLDKLGFCRTLPVESDGQNPSFTDLVRECGGDIPVRAVLDELIRVGAVVRLDNGQVRVVRQAYTPLENIEDKLNILGTDVMLLIETITHNLSEAPDNSYLQLKVSYDNLPAEAIPLLRKIAAEDGQIFLQQLNRWFSLKDRDSNPNSEEGSGRHYAGVGVYFFTQEMPNDKT